jgi:MraZ protein
LIFTGQAELVIDSKQRLAIPAKYRAQLEQQNLSKAWICVPWPGGVLRLYPESTFEALALGTGDQTVIPGRDEAELDASFFGLAERLEMDSAGRVALPRHHLDQTRLSGDVIVTGARDRLEVRDRALWNASLAERFNALPELVARIQSKRGQGSPRS